MSPKVDVVYKKKEDETWEKGLAPRVVVDLAQNFLRKGQHLKSDSFHTNPPLFFDLEKMQNYACDTIWKNRGIFQTAYRNSNIKVYTWRMVIYLHYTCLISEIFLLCRLFTQMEILNLFAEVKMNQLPNQPWSISAISLRELLIIVTVP